MQEFNINSYVCIRLTETGISILREHHNRILKAYAGRPILLEAIGEFKMPEVDENGYTQMQLWEVMQEFGNYMYQANPNPPFEMTIAIPNEYLKEQSKDRSYN